MTNLEEQKSIDPIWVRIAWHLSGHAIVAARLGFRINEGRIFMTGKHHGQVRCRLPGRTMDHLTQAERKVAALKCIAVLAAGRIAEDKAKNLNQLAAGSENEFDDHDPEGDKEQIDQFAGCAAADDEVLLESLKRNGTALAADILNKDLGKVKELAGSFLQSTGTVTQQTIYTVAGVKVPV